jgi:hypothetical protein
MTLAFFATVPKLHATQLEDLKLEIFEHQSVRTKLRIARDELRISYVEFFVFGDEFGMLIVQHRLEFRDAQSIKIRERNAREIHASIVSSCILRSDILVRHG